MDIRYFFVKDRIDKKELDVQYCPTYRMLADYYTKPLQGKAFNVFRSVLMGWSHISTLQNLTSSQMKERVEKVSQNQSSVSTSFQNDSYTNHNDHGVIRDNVSKVTNTHEITNISNDVNDVAPNIHVTQNRHVTWSPDVQDKKQALPTF